MQIIGGESIFRTSENTKIEKYVRYALLPRMDYTIFDGRRKFGWKCFRFAFALYMAPLYSMTTMSRLGRRRRSTAPPRCDLNTKEPSSLTYSTIHY